MSRDRPRYRWLEVGIALRRVATFERDRNIAGLLQALDSPLSRDTLTVAGEAARALARLDERRAIPAICAVLKTRSRCARWQAAIALREFDDEAAVRSLEAAVDDDFRVVRAIAAEALAEFGGGDMSHLRRLAASD